MWAVILTLAVVYAAWTYRDEIIKVADDVFKRVGYTPLRDKDLPVKADVDETTNKENTEMDKLKHRRGLLVYHARIDRMNLTKQEKDACAYCVNKQNDFKKEGQLWKEYGDITYCVQVVSSALVPVLIGVLGTFGESTDHLFRGVAIILSITGTVCNAIHEVKCATRNSAACASSTSARAAARAPPHQPSHAHAGHLSQVYNYRERGQTRVEYADQMSTLFQEFASLT